MCALRLIKFEKGQGVVLFHRQLAAQPSAKPTLGVWGLAPKESVCLMEFLLFPEKEAKSVVLLRRRQFSSAKLPLEVSNNRPNNIKEAGGNEFGVLNNNIRLNNYEMDIIYLAHSRLSSTLKQPSVPSWPFS
jgi:hypothetical protein